MADEGGDDSDVRCSQCQERYAKGERCPRSLFCGHTFCTTCLDRAIEEADRRCPSCGRTFFSLRATQLPTDFNLLRKATGSSSGGDRMSAGSSLGTYSSPFKPLTLSLSTGLQSRDTVPSTTAPSVASSNNRKSPLTSNEGISRNKYESEKPVISSKADHIPSSSYDPLSSSARIRRIKDNPEEPLGILSQGYRSRSKMSDHEMRGRSEKGEEEVCKRTSASSHTRLKQTISLPLVTSASRPQTLNVTEAADTEQSLASSSLLRTSSESELVSSSPATHSSREKEKSDKMSSHLSSWSPNSDESRLKKYNSAQYLHSDAVKKDKLPLASDSTDSPSSSRYLSGLQKFDKKLPNPTAYEEKKKVFDEVDHTVLSWKMDSTLSPYSSGDRTKEIKGTSSTPSHVLKMCRTIATKTRPVANISNDTTTDRHSHDRTSPADSHSTPKDKGLNWETRESRSALNIRNDDEATSVSQIPESGVMERERDRERKKERQREENSETKVTTTERDRERKKERQRDEHSETKVTTTERDKERKKKRQKDELSETKITTERDRKRMERQKDQNLETKSTTEERTKRRQKDQQEPDNKVTTVRPPETDASSLTRDETFSASISRSDTTRGPIDSQLGSPNLDKPFSRYRSASSRNSDNNEALARPPTSGDTFNEEVARIDRDPSSRISKKYSVSSSSEQLEKSYVNEDKSPMGYKSSMYQQSSSSEKLENSNETNENVSKRHNEKVVKPTALIKENKSFLLDSVDGGNTEQIQKEENESSDKRDYIRRPRESESNSVEVKASKSTPSSLSSRISSRTRFLPKTDTTDTYDYQSRRSIDKYDKEETNNGVDGRHSLSSKWRILKEKEVKSSSEQIKTIEELKTSKEKQKFEAKTSKRERQLGYTNEDDNSVLGKGSYRYGQKEEKDKTSYQSEFESDVTHMEINLDTVDTQKENPLKSHLRPLSSIGLVEEQLHEQRKQAIQKSSQQIDSTIKEDSHKFIYTLTDTDSSDDDIYNMPLAETPDMIVKSFQLSTSRSDRTSFSLTDYHSMLLGRLSRHEEFEEKLQKPYERTTSRSDKTNYDSKSNSETNMQHNSSIIRDKYSLQANDISNKSKYDTEVNMKSSNESPSHITGTSMMKDDQLASTSNSEERHTERNSLEKNEDSSTSQYSFRNHSNENKTSSMAESSKIKHRLTSYTELLDELEIGSVSSIPEEEKVNRVLPDNDENKPSTQKVFDVARRSKHDHEENKSSSLSKKHQFNQKEENKNSDVGKTSIYDHKDRMEVSSKTSNSNEQHKYNQKDESVSKTLLKEDETDGPRKEQSSREAAKEKYNGMVTRARDRIARLREKESTATVSNEAEAHKQDTTRTVKDKDKDRSVHKESEDTKQETYLSSSRSRKARYRTHQEMPKAEETDPIMKLRRARSNLRTTVATSPPRSNSKVSRHKIGGSHRKEATEKDNKDTSSSMPHMNVHMKSELRHSYKRESEIRDTNKSVKEESSKVSTTSTRLNGDVSTLSIKTDVSQKDVEEKESNVFGRENVDAAESTNTGEKMEEYKALVNDKMESVLAINEIQKEYNNTDEEIEGYNLTSHNNMPHDTNEQVLEDELLPLNLGEDTVDVPGMEKSIPVYSAQGYKNTSMYVCQESKETTPRPGVGLCRAHRLLLHRYCTKCEEWACDVCLHGRHLSPQGCHVISAEDAVSHMKLSHSTFLTSRVNTLEYFRGQLRKIVTECDQSIREHRANMDHLQFRWQEEDTLLHGIQSMRNLALEKWTQVDYWERLLGESAERITQSNSSEEVMSAVQDATSTILARVMDGANPL